MSCSSSCSSSPYRRWSSPPSVASIANLRGVTNAARLAGRTLLWFMVTSLLAVVRRPHPRPADQPRPGRHASTPARLPPPEHVGTWTDFLTGIIPTNPVGAVRRRQRAADRLPRRRRRRRRPAARRQGRAVPHLNDLGARAGPEGAVVGHPPRPARHPRPDRQRRVAVRLGPPRAARDLHRRRLRRLPPRPRSSSTPRCSRRRPAQPAPVLRRRLARHPARVRLPLLGRHDAAHPAGHHRAARRARRSTPPSPCRSAPPPRWTAARRSTRRSRRSSSRRCSASRSASRSSCSSRSSRWSAPRRPPA